MTSSKPKSHPVVKLNVGGYKFCTTIATLTKYENTFFSALFSESMPTTKDEEGAYFIDRDGQFFAPILTWLRTNEISIPTSMTKEDLIREANFYSLQPLLDVLTCTMSEDASACVENEAKIISPNEIEQHVTNYFRRHEQAIMGILEYLNRQGAIRVSIEIIPGHRQDFERPPQLMKEPGKAQLSLNMNFTILHISTYERVQCVLASHFKSKGLSGYFRPGKFIELWWNPPNWERNGDMLYF